MRKLLGRAVAYAKSKSRIEDILRYNPFYYGKVLRLIDDIKNIDLEERRRINQILLARTLKWSSACSLRGRRSLVDWPVIEKETLRANTEMFRYSKLFAIPAATSGSTGVPIRLWRSLQSVATEKAFIDNLIMPEWPPFRKARIAVLRGDYIKDPSDKSPPFGYEAQRGRRLMLSAQHISEKSAAWYANALNNYRPDLVYVYPSACEALAKHIINLGIYCSVPMILATSEVFHPSGRATVARAFNAKTVDYYGLGERVCFAGSLKPEKYYFNPAYGYVELHRNADEVEPNISSAEVVATGFWNKAMPLVRYQTGDSILIPSVYSDDDLEEVSLGSKPFLGVLGRDSDILKTPEGGVLIALNHLPREIKSIIRMQIIQERPNYVVIKILTEPGFDKKYLAILRKNVAQKIPKDISVSIERVDELERLPSGKVPYVIRKFE